MKVRDVIELIEADGWYLVVTKGSHRQYKHPQKPGRGTPQPRFSAWDTQQHSQASANQEAERRREVTMYRFLIVIEKANGNFSAYCPDLPGCVASGKTREETERNMHEAVELHVRGMLEDKMPIPESVTLAEYIAVTV